MRFRDVNEGGMFLLICCWIVVLGAEGFFWQVGPSPCKARQGILGFSLNTAYESDIGL